MKNNLLLTAMLLTGSAVLAQGTVDDYNRAYELREKYNASHVFTAMFHHAGLKVVPTFGTCAILRKEQNM